MAINIRQGFSRLNVLIQYLFVLICAAFFIEGWTSADSNSAYQWNDTFSRNLRTAVHLPITTDRFGSNNDLCDDFAGENVYDPKECKKHLLAGSTSLISNNLLSNENFKRFLAHANEVRADKVWEDRKDLAYKIGLTLLIGLIILQILASTIAWLWNGFAKPSNPT